MGVIMMNNIQPQIVSKTWRKVGLLIFSMSTLSIHAQTNQSAYLEAKRLYAEGNYKDAQGSFKLLSSDPTFGSYATFYFALTAYHQGRLREASDAWKQIRVKEPQWDQLGEVNFWITKTAFELNDYEEVATYASHLPEALAQQLAESMKGDLDQEALEKSYQSQPDNRLLASLYFQSLMSEPYETRDHGKLLSLSDQFDFEMDAIVADLPFIKKDKYSIALVLPFMFDSLQNPQSVIRNRIIYDLYQGMTMARDSLVKQGVTLVLYPFDTKKDKLRASQLVARRQLKEADLIIGPLYAGPNEQIMKFSSQYEIPLVNPLSSNIETIDGNGFAYLFKPSYETQGRQAA
ncbi:MAG: hypothetical protein AAFY41_15605, partial [Bacteroidota bacterium]